MNWGIAAVSDDWVVGDSNPSEGGQHASSEVLFVQHMAAESIQNMYKRYRDCKSHVKKRKMKSAENLVLNLAAETITSGMRRIASLSRSRSRLQMGASSGSILEVPPVPITARTIASADPKDAIRVLQITQLTVEDVSSVVWQGHNNLYCTLTLSQWEHRTPTKPEAADTANWNEITIEIPLDKDGASSTRRSGPLGPMMISVSHENMVVTDKVIGQAELLLGSIFTGDVSSDEYICPEPVDVVLTVYEGTKVKRKMKGLVKFQARIVYASFDPTRNNTKLINLLSQRSQRSQRDKMEFKLDSTSGSIATQSIDPYAMREDSGSLYDFSSTQLRNAADILRNLEAPANAKSAQPSKPASASSSRGDVRAGAAAVGPSKNSSKQINVQNQSRSEIPPPAVPPPAAPPAVPPVALSEVPSSSGQPKRSLRNPAAEGVSSSSKHAGAGTDAAAKLSATTSGARAKTPTRLRTRRTGAEEEPAASAAANGTQPEKEEPAKPRKSSVGKLSAVPAKGDSLNQTAPARVTSDSVKAGASAKSRPTLLSGTQTQPAQRSLGYHVIDEAFRLAMKKKGAYLRLTMSEVASLLATLGFTVRADLMESSAKLSHICKEHAKLPVAPAGDSHVSLPIVHAMSLAATISFLVRDHSLLRDSNDGDGSRGLGTMSELQADIALKQLVSLVEGSYADVKKFIVGVCDGVPAVSKASAAVDVGKCRPSAWSASTVQAFLQALSIQVPSGAPTLSGEELLELDSSAAFRSRFGGNPSVDITRLAVYTQALRFLDSWWDRGIRPGDSYDRDSSHLAEDKSLKSGGSKRSKSKRRGSKQSTSKLTGDWGDLSAVQDQLQDDNSSVQDTSRLGGKIVDGGRVIQSHLIKIADFQQLLESITPLNRAFGWGCSLEALVRFASIVGGMRGHLWVAGTDPCRSTHNSSFGDLSCLDNTSHSTGNIIPSNQDDIGRWVVLQKCSAPSASELTQLVRLCNDLNIVMKYASREDDFLAFLPTTCLRITSAQEVRAKNFKADLEGLLLEDISVGRKVVVADLNALTRTCERFDWWDRPSPAVLEGMCNQTGEVVSLAEVQEKRRVGVRILNSGVCDALPLEALRLCTDDELAIMQQKEEEDKEEASKPPPPPQVTVQDDDVVRSKSTGRRKSKSVNSTSRKTKLRTLIQNLNIVVKPDEVEARVPQPVKTKVAAQPVVPESAFEELSHKSELSNLSGEAELEKAVVRSSPTAKKKKAVAGPPSPLYSPQKRIVRRTMVRNTSQPDSPRATVGKKVESSAGALDRPPVMGDCDAPPVPEVETKRPVKASEVSARSSAKSSGRNSPVTHVTATVRASPELSKDDSLVTRWSTVEPAIDYSWLKGPARSPLQFTDDEPAIVSDPVPPLLPEPVQMAEKKGGPAPLHIIQASFDAERAEYTEGVPRVRATSAGTRARTQTAASGDEADDAEEPEIVNNQFRSKFVRTARPQSAPSAKGKAKRPAQAAADLEDPERTEAADKISSFGLSGLGYVGGGKLQPHANLWVNEDIPAIPDTEVPRVIPNKQPVHHKDYRTQTEKLFEFNARTVVNSPPRNGKNATAAADKKGDHFADITLQAPNGGNASPGGVRKTVKIPPRPRSATNPVSRGVTSGKQDKNVVAPADSTGAGQGTTMGTAQITGPVGPTDEAASLAKSGARPKSASGRPKRTREEELQHIAASRAARELSLQEKVLQKELKRIEVHGTL